MHMRRVAIAPQGAAIKTVKNTRYFTHYRCANRQESCKRVRHCATSSRMDALKSALQNGSSTIPWAVLQAALAQQKTTADVPASVPSTDGPRMHLDNAQLWRQFSHMTNEMIVTKAGR